MAPPETPTADAHSQIGLALSKRQKRRNNIKEKLSEMVNTFGKDQTGHYRAQLQAIQVDMTLILRADPYENIPLDESPQHIEELVDLLTGGKVPGGKAPREDFVALAGRRYFEYCQEINRAQERRDAELTMLKTQFDNASAELDRINSYKIQVAQREHVELSSTIRQRLINTVTKKRDRLMREKEQLDIADSNSLLLHPNQYAINIPASPGGLLSNRKTRHTRNRLGDGEEERGRKRKLPGEEDGVDSPIPGYRPGTQDGSGAYSPYQEHRAKALRTQQEAPAYSIESIFTEKELQHATNNAQNATQIFFDQQQQATQEQTNDAPETNGKPDASTAADGDPSTAAEESKANAPPASQPEATGMARQVSNYATRGATRANPLMSLSEAAAAVSAPGATANPFQPVMIPITKTDKGAPTPPGASVPDILDDMMIIRAEGFDYLPDDYIVQPAPGSKGPLTVSELNNMFLEQACREPMATQPFRIPLTDVGPAMVKDGVNRPAAIGFADPASIPNGVRDGTAVPAVAAAAASSNFAQASAGGLAMSRQTSMAGSEMGASEMGGVGMRRTRSRAV